MLENNIVKWKVESSFLLLDIVKLLLHAYAIFVLSQKCTSVFPVFPGNVLLFWGFFSKFTFKIQYFL